MVIKKKSTHGEREEGRGTYLLLDFGLVCVQTTGASFASLILIPSHSVLLQRREREREKEEESKEGKSFSPFCLSGAAIHPRSQRHHHDRKDKRT